MAKVRVYELARELDLDSKELVKKLQNGGMKIKNYMSTLDDGAVEQAKQIVAGKVSEVIEEKRIKPTVIRRRRKTIKVRPAPVVAEEKAPAEAEAAPEGPEMPPEEVRETVKRARDGAPEPPLAEPPTAETERAGLRERPAAEPEAAEPEEQAPLGVQEAEPAEAEEEAFVAEAEEAPVAAEDTVQAAKTKRETKPKIKDKGKKAKKKVDQPARIVRRAEEGPLSALLKKQKEEEALLEVQEEVAAPGPDVPQETKVVPLPDKKERPGRKKEKKRTEKSEGIRKGVGRQRKVEVFERAELYDGRPGKRKDKQAARRGKDGKKRLKHTEITVPKAIKRRLKVPESMTVAELARAMGIKAVEIIRHLLNLGIGASMNQPVDFESAALVADEFGYELELDRFEVESLLTETEDRPQDMKPRPPVVTIMGHVDHGKTSLLDYIRSSNIIAGESGGITQHIGAYYVERDAGDIVFLDTPGHEAFTAMRARGAKVTDIIVLVVAADDGVMPQTKEAVNHARAAEIPIIVAVNKMDKPEANPDKVRRELAELELVPEEWGGDTIMGNISAKTGEGVEELLELILLQAEMLELKENAEKPARGAIIEARLDRSRGPVATVLIKSGTLHQGDYFVCGGYYGKVRAMLNNRGRRMQSAGPSFPAEIYGISGVPMAGDEFIVVPDEKTAKQVIDHRQARLKAQGVGKRGIVSLDDLFEKIKQGEVKELNIVIKADVQGSLEALSDSLLKLSTDQVKLQIIHSSTGAITETDVMLASASGAIVIGFNVRANPRVAELAEKEKVDIRHYEVIYNVIKDIRAAMVGLLEPIYKEHIIGRVDIKETFHVPKVGVVAGCIVTDGHVERNANARLLRDDVVIFDGRMASLRRFKEDVREVQSGYECGIGLENFQDLKPGDVVEVYKMEELQAEL